MKCSRPIPSCRHLRPPAAHSPPRARVGLLAIKRRRRSLRSDISENQCSGLNPSWLAAPRVLDGMVYQARANRGDDELAERVTTSPSDLVTLQRFVADVGDILRTSHSPVLCVVQALAGCTPVGCSSHLMVKAALVGWPAYQMSGPHVEVRRWGVLVPHGL